MKQGNVGREMGHLIAMRLEKSRPVANFPFDRAGWGKISQISDHMLV